MADKGITIAINTTANVAGVAAAKDGIASLSMTVDRFLSVTDKAKVDQWGFYDLDVIPKKVQNVGNEVAEAGKKVSRAGFLWNQAGVQLGDFTTQVSMGTSASRAFSMQAPQMLGMLSTAGVLGTKAALAMTGLGAAIPLVTMAAPALLSFFSSASAKAIRASENIEGMGKRLAAISSGSADRVIEKLDAAEEKSRTLDITVRGVGEAQEKAAKSQLSNAQILAEAEKNLNVVLGIRIEQFREIQKANKAAAEERQKMLEAERTKEKEEQDKIQREIDRVDETRSGKAAQLEKQKAIQDNAERYLQKLREKKPKLQEDIENRPMWWQGDSPAGLMPEDDPRGTPSERRAKADAAEADLKDLEAQIKEKQDEINGRASTIKKLETLIGNHDTFLKAKAEELAQRKNISWQDDQQRMFDANVADQGDASKLMAASAQDDAQSAKQIADLLEKNANAKENSKLSDKLASQLETNSKALDAAARKVETANANAEKASQRLEDALAKLDDAIIKRDEASNELDQAMSFGDARTVAGARKKFASANRSLANAEVDANRAGADLQRQQNAARKMEREQALAEANLKAAEDQAAKAENIAAQSKKILPAVAALKSAAEDGVIASNDMNDLRTAIATLVKTLSMSASDQKLHAAVKQLIANVEARERDAQNLKKRVEQLEKSNNGS